jgi:TrmH family RNA methyltransferase
VQRLRRLVQRRQDRLAERAFVLEGPTLVAEALDAGIPLEALFVAPEANGMVIDAARRAGVAVHELRPGVMERVAGTVTPQPVAAVAPFVDVTIEGLVHATLVVVCVDVRDPGNLGTVLRSAEAAGADAVIRCDRSADLYNPKTVRASAGSLFRVPVVAGGEPAGVLEELGRAGLRRVGTSAHGGAAPEDVDLTAPVALVFGNEARGLPPGLSSSVDETVTIPMAGRAESLNVGMAAAVLCFEAARQRRAGEARR